MQRRFARAASAAGLVLLSACGGGNTPTPVPTPVPTPPPPQVVAEDSGAIPAGFAAGGYFSITRPGTIDATVDWTFPTSLIVVLIARGQCTEELFAADQCDFVAESFGGPKPRTVTVRGAAAGTYTIIVANLGDVDEAVAIQIVLTPSGASASRAGGAGAGLEGGWSRKGLPRR